MFSPRIHEYMDYYKILGLPTDVATDKIAKTYNLAIKNYTPEIAGSKISTIKFQQIFEAYYILKDDFRRQNYDKFYNSSLLESIEFKLWRKNQFKKLRESKQDDTNFISLISSEFFGNIIVEVLSKTIETIADGISDIS